MTLTEEQINAKLDEVKKIQIILDPDPTVKGLVSLNYKIAEIQLAKDRVSSMLLEAMRNMSELEVLKEAVQHEHDRKLDVLLATDTDVMAGKSVEARNVLARTKMTDLVLKLHHQDIDSIKGSWYLKTLQMVHGNLESANNNLSRQITVIQMDQNLQGNNGLTRGTIKTMNM